MSPSRLYVSSFPLFIVSCDLLALWLKKCSDDSEVTHRLVVSRLTHSQTSNWIAANTKLCPKCNSIIEKNGGMLLLCCWPFLSIKAATTWSVATAAASMSSAGCVSEPGRPTARLGTTAVGLDDLHSTQPDASALRKRTVLMPAPPCPRRGNRSSAISSTLNGWCLLDVVVVDFSRYQNHEQSKRLEKKLNIAISTKMDEWQATVAGCTWQDVKVLLCCLNRLTAVSS
jgi:hypothetical protein